VIDAVLDTNVLASGIASIARPESTPGEILRRWRAKSFILIVSHPILAELMRTLTNPYFASRISPAEIEAIFTRLRSDARLQPITAHPSGIASHAEDDRILATALRAQAEYLVTGDKRLLDLGNFLGTRLLSPGAFLARLAEAGDPVPKTL
jgi:putative PIN family toxin of toxin-antitoxin system